MTINKTTAVDIAKTYLSDELLVDVPSYHNAVIFVGSANADRYLQKALGFDKSIEFIKKHGLEYFFWKVRFYKENEQEEYRLTISAATGEITNFKHTILDSDSRPEISEPEAQERAVQFLIKKFNFNPDEYILHSNLSKKFDHRVDYSFVWEKKGVYVPWSEDADSGGAKILVGIQISGDEILTFNKNSLDIPEKFNIYIARLKTTGRNLALIFRMVFFSLLASSIFYVVVRRNDLVMHTTKNFCVGLTGAIFILNILTYFNEFESVIYHYNTTSSFASYIWRAVTQFFMDSFIVTISILMPCLTGESLHYEQLREKKEGAFLHYLLSSFRTRNVAGQITLGYTVAIIMIGIQSFAFEFGQRYLNVWVEYTWMAQLSASFFPFLTAFTMGFIASSTEEIAFRLFSISLGKKFLKNTVFAALLASIIWGYGHSTYLVFPMWFRGLEVTTMGIFLSIVYLRFGIIPVLIAHFLFDVFWGSSAYLLGRSTPYHFYSAVFILLLPLIYAAYAYITNLPETERPMHWRLSKHQLFNLEVLKYYLRGHPIDSSKNLEDVKHEIKNHGWDISVVELALEEILNNKKAQKPGQTTQR
ncbi:MAG: CPBP family intramembrane glutamic endopeptidase [Candidatus Omnitrophota bacterium]